MAFIPLEPNAGPTGGDGAAWPAPTISFTITFFAACDIMETNSSSMVFESSKVQQTEMNTEGYAVDLNVHAFFPSYEL